MDQISLQDPKSHEESIKSQDKSVIHSENPVTLVAENETLAFPNMPSLSTLNTQKPSPLSSNKGTPRASIKSDGKRKNRTLSPQSPKSISLKSPMGGKLTDIASTLNRELEKDPSTEDLITTRSPVPVINNIDKIANMTKKLTNEANALRESIKSLSDDITKTKEVLASEDIEDVNFPYHLFLIELIINRIHMKCDCFELDYNNLVIAANFLGKQPIVLYDMSYGKVVDFDHLNVGKSILFAMTYDKICGIKEFVVSLQMSKQPPCSNCVTKIAETKMDYTKQFAKLREELCKKWAEEQPTDNIICTTSTPLSKQMFYLYCGDSDHSESIGMVEITTRMSFLGKEITTAFSATSKPQGTAYLRKEDNGMSLYACQNVEMDCQGKVLLDEEDLTRREVPRSMHTMSSRRPESPVSQLSTFSPHTTKEYGAQQKDIYNQGPSKYDEIFAKVNSNELKIRVPKSTKVDRMGKYDRIQELCTCEETPYNTGDQIQFQLPNDRASNTYTSNLMYTHKTQDKRPDKDRRIINITPSNCPVPVNMSKQIHPQKDVFILKIGKKLETKDKKTDLEIELITPKAPQQPIINNNLSQQCSSSDIKSKPSKSDVKKGKKKKTKSKTDLKAKKSKSKTAKKSKKNKK
ncbi:uncharacterized protein LOC123689862 isoform X2 [Pieris rapae]|uniref:uncharacterized protein LOC123689862 isoform X2 n=1 Tax=Pieris rapae TaxID=64459 RepID=UPI001E28028D|nr:uncharacterized protein LOC123689862 isoform X2 [Pieris rapae]